WGCFLPFTAMSPAAELPRVTVTGYYTTPSTDLQRPVPETARPENTGGQEPASHVAAQVPRRTVTSSCPSHQSSIQPANLNQSEKFARRFRGTPDARTPLIVKRGSG